MTMVPETPTPTSPLEGGGETGALVRSLDWSRTAVGPIPRWSPALKTTVATLLHSPQPMVLWWGADLVQFYNDAYKHEVLGERHPRAMGQPGRECWKDLWPVMGPPVEEAKNLGRASLVPVRHLDDSRWTYAYSPIFEEREGPAPEREGEREGDDEARIGGVLLVCNAGAFASAALGGPVSDAADGTRGREAPARVAAAGAKEATGSTPTSKRILVVDDNVDSAEMLGEVLRGSGHEVVVAHDPAAALATLGGFRPEIAILDIGLPIMDGYELAQRIQATLESARCRLIALTGYGQRYDRAHSVSTGFSSHLVKPVDLDALEHIIDGL